MVARLPTHFSLTMPSQALDRQYVVLEGASVYSSEDFLLCSCIEGYDRSCSWGASWYLLPSPLPNWKIHLHWGWTIDIQYSGHTVSNEAPTAKERHWASNTVPLTRVVR